MMEHHDGPYNAIQRFAESMRAMTEAARAFSAALSGLKLDEDYRASGWPFGATDEAVEIWYEYGQWTTVN